LYGERGEDIYDNDAVIEYLRQQPFLSSTIQASIVLDSLENIVLPEDISSSEDPYVALFYIISNLEEFLVKYLVERNIISSITVSYPDKWEYYKSGDILYFSIYVPFYEERFFCMFVQIIKDFFIKYMKNYQYADNLNITYDKIDDLFIIKDYAVNQRIFTKYIKNLGENEESFYDEPYMR
jgi:hypothetical protein